MLCPHCQGQMFPDRPPVLSARQVQVLTLLKAGLDHPEVAKRLHLGLNTVYAHTKRIRRYFGVNTTVAAVIKATAWGVI